MISIKPLASSSRGNAYHVTDGVTPLLIECGIPWKQIRQGVGFKTSEIAGCLVSHEHKDHCKAVEDAMRAGIDVYASKGTFDALGLMTYRTCIAQATVQFRLGTWAILPFDVQHDASEPLGFLLANRAGDKLLFATDTYYIRCRFKNLTHLMIECNHSYEILDQNVQNGSLPLEQKNRLIKSHFSLENVKEFLRANDLANAKEIWLLHLSDGNSDAELFRREIQAVTGKPVYIAKS